MVEHCSHPGCYKNSDDSTLYVEQSRHDDKTFTVCGEHANFDKVNDTIVNDAASEANAEILAALKRQ
jgi:hypothetical protein